MSAAVTWREGVPDYDEHSEVLGDRHLWLRLEDQGGRPYVAVGYLHGVFPPGRFALRVAPALVAWLRVPQLGVDEPLEAFFSLTHYAELAVPDVAVCALVRGTGT